MTWRIATIDQDPDKTLAFWMVMEVPVDGAKRPGTRHFVGFSLEGCKGQVSSPVEVFDPVHRRAMTRTGQVYKPGGLPKQRMQGCNVATSWHHPQEA